MKAFPSISYQEYRVCVYLGSACQGSAGFCGRLLSDQELASPMFFELGRADRASFRQGRGDFHQQVRPWCSQLPKGLPLAHRMLRLAVLAGGTSVWPRSQLAIRLPFLLASQIQNHKSWVLDDHWPANSQALHPDVRYDVHAYGLGLWGAGIDRYGWVRDSNRRDCARALKADCFAHIQRPGRQLPSCGRLHAVLRCSDVWAF